MAMYFGGRELALLDSFDIEETFTDRQTANGKIFLDGSPAVVKKIAGKTVKTTNLMCNLWKNCSAYWYQTGVLQTRVGLQNLISVKPSTYYSLSIPTDFPLRIAIQQYTSDGKTLSKDSGWKTENFSVKTESDTSYIWVITSAPDYAYNIAPEDVQKHNIMLNEGSTEKPFVPYFSGLKHAYFKAIKSTGKQLIPFPYNFTDYSSNGANITTNNDGSLTIDGTPNGRVYRGITTFVLEKGTYTLSSNYNDAAKAGLLLYLANAKHMNDESKAIYLYYGKATFTVTTTTEYKVVVRLDNGATFNKYRFEPMLSIGSVQQPFEPYKAPQEYKYDNFRTTNLFNAKNINNTIIQVNEDGGEITMPLATAGNGMCWLDRTFRELCPEVKTGDVIYFKFNRVYVGGEDALDWVNNYIYFHTVDYLWGAGNALTVTEELLNAKVSIYGNRFIDNETKQVILKDFRIVKNPDDEFKPYESDSIELAEYDYIDPQKGELVRQTKTLVLEGTEEWFVEDTLSSYRIGLRLVDNAPHELIFDIPNIVSNLYETVTPSNTFDGRKGITIHGNILYVRDGNYATNDISLWKSHLAELYANGTPLVVEYKLVTPTIETLTDYPKAYKSYSGGREQVEQGDTDNSQWGAKSSLVINYPRICKMEV